MKPSERMDWLTIPGWCAPEEGDALYEVVANHLTCGDQVVDIGTYYGKSAVALGLGALLSGAHVRSYDRDRAQARQTAAAQMIERFGLGQAVTLAVTDAKAAITHAPFALVYVDGWHDSINVRDDVRLFWPWLRHGGYLVLHDNCDAWPAVQEVVAELTDMPGLNRLPDIVSQAWFQRYEVGR